MTSNMVFSCNGCSSPGEEGDNVEYVGNNQLHSFQDGEQDSPPTVENCCAARLVAIDAIVLRSLENDIRDLQQKAADQENRFQEVLELDHRVSLLEGPHSRILSRQTSRLSKLTRYVKGEGVAAHLQEVSVLEADLQGLRHEGIDGKTIMVGLGKDSGLEQNGTTAQTDCVSASSLAEVPTILVDAADLQGLSQMVAEEEFALLTLADCVARLQQAAAPQSGRSTFTIGEQDMNHPDSGVRVPEAELRRLRETLADKQRYVNELLGVAEQMVKPRSDGALNQEDSDTTPAGRTRCCVPFETAVAVADVLDSELKVDATIWEAVVFCGLSLVATPGSCILVLSLVFNMAWQLAFCWMIAASPGFAQELPEAATIRKWRETVAHNIQYMDAITHESLARRICTGDNKLPASALQELVHDIVRYTDRWLFIEHGYLLLVMVLILWFMLITREVWKTLSFGQAMFTLPRSRKTVLTGGSHHLVFESLSKGRCIFMMMVTTCRIWVATMLAVSGSIWLSNTTKIEDIVLNAAALAIVFKFQEIFSFVAVPQQLQILVRKPDPLKLPKQRFRRGSSWLLLGILLIGPVLAVIVASFAGREHRDRLRDIYKEACGGEHNFVYALNPVTGSVVTASSPEVSMSNAMVMDPLGVRNIVSDIIWHGQALGSGIDKPYFVEPVWVVQEVQGKSITEMSELVSQCKDRSFGRAAPHTAALRHAIKQDRSFGRAAPHTAALRHAIKQELGSWDDTWSCGDLSAYCQQRRLTSLRYLCPETCGCSEPLKGLLWRRHADGCPERACKAAFKGTQQATCKDIPTDTLQNLTGWAAYWESYRAYANEEAGRRGTDWANQARRFGTWAKQAGCQAIRQPNAKSQFCHGATFSSLQAFCPETCGSEYPRACGMAELISGNMSAPAPYAGTPANEIETSTFQPSSGTQFDAPAGDRPAYR